MEIHLSHLAVVPLAARLAGEVVIVEESVSSASVGYDGPARDASAAEAQPDNAQSSGSQPMGQRSRKHNTTGGAGLPAHPVAIGLGGNLGDVVGAFRHARQRFADLLGPGAKPGAEPGVGSGAWRFSSLYGSRPWGVDDQPDYINAVAVGRTFLSPSSVLAGLQQIEQECARERLQRWGPRTLDLDLLLFGACVVRRADLQVPHPRMYERGFVLVPLAEVVPQWVPPLQPHTTEQLARAWERSEGSRGALWRIGE